jgi:3-oxoadipate enol-lactonase
MLENLHKKREIMMAKVTVNGTEIYYEVKGEGEPILFLHGMGGTWMLWEPQMSDFSRNYRMLMVDLRGQGHWGQSPGKLTL